MTPHPPSQGPQQASPKTLWSRLIFISGMTLLVSFGLCGLNFAAVLGVTAGLSGSAHNHVRQSIGRTLILLGYVEVFGMVVGVLGLVISLIGAAIASLTGRNKT